MIRALDVAPGGGSRFARAYFERALELGRLSHAYLFAGPRGSGKREFVLELARLLLCEERRACGACAECLRVSSGNHPGVHVFGPPEGKAHIDVDTVRALCDRTHFKASTRTVLGLEDAERLTEPAANALLKTLEEPPPRTVIILTVQSTGALLSTIVSRCHRIPFSPPGEGGGDGAGTLGPGELDAIIDEVRAPGFFAATDLKGWLAGRIEGQEGARGPVRALLHALVAHRRAGLELPGGGPLEGEVLDAEVRALEQLLGLCWALEANVHPELVLERLLRLLRGGA